MTVDEVRGRYADEVIAVEGDAEVAHGNEDSLMLDVIRHCADADPVAAAFVEVYDAHLLSEPTRWYA